MTARVSIGYNEYINDNHFNPMKVNRNGKATSLTQEQFEQLLEVAPSPKHRMLWALQRYTAGRIGETLSLTWADITSGFVVHAAAKTKMKKTRQVPVCPQLQAEIDRYRAAWVEEHGSQPRGGEYPVHSQDSTTQPLTRQAADYALRTAAKAVGLVGVSTHSFRRTAAQLATDGGVPLTVVQALTGHASLSSLSEYLEPSPAQILTCFG